MPSDHTLLNLDASHAIPTRVLRFEVSGLRRRTPVRPVCRMDLLGPTTLVGTRTDYSVGPWDYPAYATWHLMA
jgi:hypothetical protein